MTSNNVTTASSAQQSSHPLQQMNLGRHLDSRGYQEMSPPWSTKLSFLFGMTALLGVILLIFSEVAWSAPNHNAGKYAARAPAQQNGGFKPGGAQIGNPLNDPEFEEDDEGFEDFDDSGDNSSDFEENAPQPRFGGARNKNQNPNARNDINNMGNQPNPGISVGGSVDDDKPGPELKRAKGGFALSGPGTEKGIKAKNEVPILEVDNESGDGSPANKEMITDFNFPDADVLDIAKTLGRLTGKNFLLDKDVKGRVSIISNSPITVSDAWRAFLTTLDMNGLALVPTGKYLRIMRQNDAKGKNVRLYSHSRAPNTDALVTKIFKIKYISAKELENVIRTYANMGARIYGFEQTNTLIITDTGSNIDKIAKMISFLDVEGFDAGIEVLAVKYASAVELSKLIDSLLPGTPGAFPGGRPGGFGGSTGGGRNNSGFSARRTKEGGIVNNIIADERTNTLIVHANPKGVEQVRELIARLDRKMPAALGGGKVHVTYLQFAEAEEMAKTLNNFNQQGKTGGGGFGGLPGGPIGGIGINPNESNLFEGQIKVAADKQTNSLVITASPSDYATLQRVINKLDIPRDQIYVEIVIMEMSMQRANEYTANILGPKGTSVAPTTDLFNLIVDPTKAASQKGLVLRWADTSNQTEVQVPGTGNKIQVPNLAALLKAIQTYSNANILATPQLMTLDNTEATFESSDKIPVPTVTNTGLGTSQVSVTKETVPLSIKIKPQLNKISNFIKLDIKAKVSDISNRALPKAVEDQAFATLERNAETSVMVSDTDTVVLGGLIRDKSTESINKVPLLGDIPILGWLFKSRSALTEKSNLLLFITPKIMRQPENVRAVLDKKLKERDEFVETAMGGEDRLREHRNDIIRSLPDVKKITNYNSRRLINLDDDDAVKEKAKEQAALDADKAHEGSTPDGHETLTIPAATGPDAVKNSASNGASPSRGANDFIPPPVAPPQTAMDVPDALPPVSEPPPMSQPSDSNFAPIAPAPGSSDPFGGGATP
ncbi:MAG: type II secretion system secretin GspD [Bdellovibrionales bacterium]|nr:type II secretion system secretin GspD [Bdellovibrionales bacterium]